LNPTTDEVLVAPIPTGPVPAASPLNNPLGIDAEGVVAFTTAGEIPGFNKVGMLFPDGEAVIVRPTTPEEVVFDQHTFVAAPRTILRFTGTAEPFAKNAPAQETDTTGGTFFEANIDLAIADDADACPEGTDLTDLANPCTPSTLPRGIDEDPNGRLGDYYAAIGGSVLRIARVSLPTPAGGAVSGGGWIEMTSETPSLTGITKSTAKGTFGLTAMRKRPGEPVRGHVTYQNHSTGDKVISLELTDLNFVDGNRAVIGGACRPNGSQCVQFKVDVTDVGRSRSSNRDRFEIVRDPLLLGTGVAEGGPLEGGNLKVYQGP
jgi:hypothetical protein